MKSRWGNLSEVFWDNSKKISVRILYMSVSWRIEDFFNAWGRILSLNINMKELLITVMTLLVMSNVVSAQQGSWALHITSIMQWEFASALVAGKGWEVRGKALFLPVMSFLYWLTHMCWLDGETWEEMEAGRGNTSPVALGSKSAHRCLLTRRR